MVTTFDWRWLLPLVVLPVVVLLFWPVEKNRDRIEYDYGKGVIYHDINPKKKKKFIRRNRLNRKTP